MKSPSDGPSANVVAKVVVFDTVGPGVAGVAKERICLITEARTRREWVRMRDIVSQRLRELLTPTPSRKDSALGSLNQARCLGPLIPVPPSPSMNTLSRREEDTLFKATKAYALRECDELVKGTYAHCKVSCF
jgi:hypothetical protein